MLLLATQWWPTPLIPALRKQRKADLCEFEASLVYKVSFRIDRAVTQRNPASKQTTKQNLLLLILSFNPWWSDGIQGVISIFFYLLRLILCPSTW